MKLLVFMVLICVLFLLQRIVFERIWDKNLSLELSFQDHVVREGNQTYLIERVRNQKHFPLPILHVKLMMPRSFLFASTKNANVTDYYYRNDIFSVGSNEELVRKLPFTCSKRGFYQINDMTYSSRDYFLTDSFVNAKKVTEFMYVTPKKYLPREIPIEVHGIIGDVISKKTLLDDPFAFKGIRQYQPYDNYHAINWKATARQQELQVNTFFSTYSCEVFLVLNLTPVSLYNKNFLREESIAIASTLSSHFLHRNIPVGFTTNALDIETHRSISLMPGVGQHHENNIDLKLARIDLSQEQEPLEIFLPQVKVQKNTQVIFISADCTHETVSIYEQMCSAAGQVIWIRPYDPYRIDNATDKIADCDKSMMNWEVNTGDDELKC